MTENETQDPQEQTAEVEQAAAAETESPAARAQAHHESLVALFRESVDSEGEAAFQRWGLPLLHSLSDEEFETQREKLAVELTDPLDFYNRGCLHASREEYDQALACFDEALKRREQTGDDRLEQAPVLYNRAVALELLDRKRDAHKAWLDYIERFAETQDAAEIQEIKQHLATLA